MSSELSSIPLPDLERTVAGNSPTENSKTVKVENPERPTTSPLSEPGSFLSSPSPSAQSESIEMASTPPTRKSSDGQSNTVNNSGCRPDADEDSTSQNPADQMEEFDWNGLRDRYEKAMEQCRKSEEALSDEVEQLVKYFKVWADSTTHYESHRSSNRLKTRITHVQNSEEDLGERRTHYVKVVEAFKSALELLNS